MMAGSEVFLEISALFRVEFSFDLLANQAEFFPAAFPQFFHAFMALLEDRFDVIPLFGGEAELAVQAVEEFEILFGPA